jgi:hypothetical protein
VLFRERNRFPDAVKHNQTRINLFNKRPGLGLHKPNREVFQLRSVMASGRLARPKSAESV